MAKKVKVSRRRGHTRISRKNQVTIPIDAMREAGLRAGDELRVKPEAPGRVVLKRTRRPVEEWLAEHAGTVAGDVYPPDYLEELRREWGP